MHFHPDNNSMHIDGNNPLMHHDPSGIFRALAGPRDADPAAGRYCQGPDLGQFDPLLQLRGAVFGLMHPASREDGQLAPKDLLFDHEGV